MKTLYILTAAAVMTATFFATHARADAKGASGSARLMSREVSDQTQRKPKLVIEYFAQVTVENPVVNPNYLSCEATVSLFRTTIEQGQKIEHPMGSRKVSFDKIAPGQTSIGEAPLWKTRVNYVGVRLSSLECVPYSANVLIEVPAAGLKSTVSDAGPASTKEVSSSNLSASRSPIQASNGLR